MTGRLENGSDSENGCPETCGNVMLKSTDARKILLQSLIKVRFLLKNLKIFKFVNVLESVNEIEY